MADTFAEHYLELVVRDFERIKELAERALAQVPDEAFYHAPDPESNSIAVLVKHVAGNLRSRWTDFLTTDGEKPDRDRDREFEIGDRDTRAALMAAWEDGWARLFAALRGLGPDDLAGTVRIRGEPHTVPRAIHRQLTHNAYHAGQIVYLAKHLRAGEWRTLSIARGESRQFNERMGY